jgi:pimeloyl-ACP methyl ester carboxylesterase
MNKKKILRWIKVIALLYGSIGIALYYLQEKFLFHPKVLPTDYVFNFSTPFEEVSLPLNAATNINMVKFFSTDTATKGVVLYFHGNKTNITRYAKFVNTFTKNGYEVWMPDYPGYGKSTGKRTEAILYEIGEQLYKMANAKYKEQQIIVYGKSLGTAIASYVAANHKPQQLILETPYYSIPSLFSSWLTIYPHNRSSTYKLPTGEYVKEVKTRVTIFHGTNDWVVPYRNAKKIKTVLKPSDEFITIDGGNHQNLNTYDLYQKKMDSLLRF